MTAQLVTIEKASPACLEEVLNILTRVELPHDGVKEHFEGFLVARAAGEFFSGASAWSDTASSVFSAPPQSYRRFQGQWIGNKLVRELLKRAASDGLTEVALLTTTAKDFFQNKFGFKEARRFRYEKRLSNSPEWNLPRCSSAAFMTLKL